MIKKTLLKTTSLITLTMTICAFSPILANAAWKQDSTGWWYTEGNSYATRWRQIDGSWYFFDASGYMKTGWVKDSGSWYFMNSSGAMQTGWINDGGSWYFLNSSGVMQTGWVQSGSSWYFMNNSGVMQTGWVQQGNDWFYMNNSGTMITGRQQIGNTWYCFNASGYMVTQAMIDGYYYDKNGACTSPKATIAETEVIELIKKNDGEYLKEFEDEYITPNDGSCELRLARAYKLSDLINIDNAGIKDEPAYFAYLLVWSNVETSNSYSSTAYLVGATTGDVYCIGSQGGLEMYQMKDNEIVKTCYFNGMTTGTKWR